MWYKIKINKNLFNNFLDNTFLDAFNNELENEEFSEEFIYAFLKNFNKLIENTSNEEIICEITNLLNNKNSKHNELFENTNIKCESCSKTKISDSIFEKEILENENSFWSKSICICEASKEREFNKEIFFSKINSLIYNYFLNFYIWSIELNEILNSDYFKQALFLNRDKIIINDEEIIGFSDIIILSEKNYNDIKSLSILSNKLNNLIISTFSKLDSFEFYIWILNENIYQNEEWLNEIFLKTNKKNFKKVKRNIKNIINGLKEKLAINQENLEDIKLRSSIYKDWIRNIRNNIAHNFTKFFNEYNFTSIMLMDLKKVKIACLLIIDNILSLYWLIYHFDYLK